MEVDALESKLEHSGPREIRPRKNASITQTGMWTCLASYFSSKDPALTLSPKGFLSPKGQIAETGGEGQRGAGGGGMALLLRTVSGTLRTHCRLPGQRQPPARSSIAGTGLKEAQ